MSQLKEAIEILESTFTDRRNRYPGTITNEQETFPCITSRTEHLEVLIEEEKENIIKIIRDLKDRGVHNSVAVIEKYHYITLAK
jgi:hypothetical protein